MVADADAADRSLPASVLVVGGGLIGCHAAYFLAERGLQVTVLEGQGLGSGASRGNCGEVTSLVEPLAAPGVVREGLPGLWRRDHPLFLRLPPSPSLVRFLIRFVRAANRPTYLRGLTALHGLFGLSARLYDRLAEEGLAAPMRRDGYLEVFLTEERARAHHRQLATLAADGLVPSPGPLLGPVALRELEPLLAPTRRLYGFLRPGERWLEPGPYLDRLAARLRRMGVQLVEGAWVRAVVERDATVQVESSRGRFVADAAVIAAGAGSREVAGLPGMAAVLQPGKGYSFSVRPPRLPRRVIELADAHIVATPFEDRLRLGGTLEFDGTSDRFHPARIRALVTKARRLLSGIDWEARTEEWVGPRPMTPDGLPLIGRVPGRRRTWLATGHNMLGLTLAPATGHVVAELVTEGRACVEVGAFAPERFDPRGASRRAGEVGG